MYMCTNRQNNGRHAQVRTRSCNGQRINRGYPIVSGREAAMGRVRASLQQDGKLQWAKYVPRCDRIVRIQICGHALHCYILAGKPCRATFLSCRSRSTNPRSCSPLLHCGWQKLDGKLQWAKYVPHCDRMGRIQMRGHYVHVYTLADKNSNAMCFFVWQRIRRSALFGKQAAHYLYLCDMIYVPQEDQTFLHERLLSCNTY